MDNLYFFCVFITIAGVELLSRLTFPDHADDDKYLSMAFTKLLNSSVVFDSSQQNYSKKFGFRLSANAEKRMVSDEFEFTARTNSLGFRSKEINPKRNDEYRVLLLGDTFFWGMGVEEENMISSNLELMESQLSIPHLSLSVYNYSMPGYNTSQESLVLRAYAHQVNPDHVILGFFPGNDVIPNALTFIDEEGNIASHHEMIQRAKKNLRRSFSLLFHSIVFRILAVSTYVPKVRYEIATRGEIIRRSYALLKELKRETQSLGSWLSVVIIHPRDSVSGGLVQA